jgi:hypothetical protein
LDKLDALHTAIRWKMETLKNFIAKRIVLNPKIKQGPFQTLWRQIFPEAVTNIFHRIEEDSFDYLARHTMLRPRQLQIHLGTLASNHRGANIDPSMVPKSVAESNRKLATHFINENLIDHPNLEGMILSFERRDNVMSFNVFREKIATSLRKAHGPDHGLNVDEEIDALYVMGLLGVLRFVEDGDMRRNRYYPPCKESRQHYVDFYYSAPDTKISARLADDTPVALHPIFVDFANLRPHPSLIIG